MKLSIVIICWNDLKDIEKCLQSVYAETKSTDFEVIVTDNASTDGSVSFVRAHFPQVRIVENRVNRGFGSGNNEGFKIAQGEYILILNPDTLIHDGALDKFVQFADQHPEAGAFGCRILNADGSFQKTAQPLPTLFRYLIAALHLRGLGRISEKLVSDCYIGWDGLTEREIGFQAGCCLLVRGALLKKIGGFDPRFFHQFEDADLCHRLWQLNKPVLYCPTTKITHVGGQNRGRYPIKVILETERSKYRFFYKHYGGSATICIRVISLIHLGLRYLAYRTLDLFKDNFQERLAMYRLLIWWHWQINPISFSENGVEPESGYAPLGTSSDKEKASPESLNVLCDDSSWLQN